MSFESYGSYRLRVQTCIRTIIDVHEGLSSELRYNHSIGRFTRLKDTLADTDMNGVSEQDVMLVEQATNDFLAEFRKLFEGGHHNIYSRTLH